jgi:sugar lactone lactonase YvrE
MSKSTLSVMLSGLIFVLCCLSCKKNTTEPLPPTTNPPTTKKLAILSLSINSGRSHAGVIITGVGFVTDVTKDKVTFNGKLATVYNATDTTLNVSVPVGAGTGLVMVSVGDLTATGPVFTYERSLTGVYTFAGNDRDTSIDGTGTSASFHGVRAITSDKLGNVYVTDPMDHIIRKITPDAVVTTFAGGGKAGFANAKGRAALFHTPSGIAADSDGNVFVNDLGNRVIRKITPDGTVTTFVGAITNPFKDGTGTAAGFVSLNAITIDKNNNLFVLDGNSFRKITPAGVVTTLPPKYPSNEITGFAIDNDGTFYMSTDQMIISLTQTGVVGLVAGTDLAGYQNGPGNQAQFYYPSGIAFDKAGNLIVADTDNNVIRIIYPSGYVLTLVGNRYTPFPVVDGPDGVATFYAPLGLTFDPSGNLFVLEEDHRVRKLIFE